MADITVSIITPCYNGARFLRTTLDSVLAQTRLPLEIIVIDDGSTDDSASIAESFGPLVRVLRQPNRGESSARNAGIAHARGTHLLFLDADDLLAPEALARLTDRLIDRPDAVALMGCRWFEDDPGQPYATRAPATDVFFPAIMESNFGPPHSWLAPADVVKRAGGFYVPLQWFEDWDLWWRVGLLGVELVLVDYPGALYRRHAASQLATTKLADRTWGHACLVERMAGALLERPDMIDQYGSSLFWSCWTAMTRARHAGVPWSRLDALNRRLREVSRRLPPQSRSLTARAISTFGARTTVTIARLMGRRPDSDSPVSDLSHAAVD